MAKEFHYRRMVQWVDTDRAGIIHFSNYFRYMEETEMQFFMALGFKPPRDPAMETVLRPRVSAQCDFKRMVTFGDLLDIRLEVAKVGRSSITLEFVFTCEGEEVARGSVTSACVERDANGRPRAVSIPDDMRAALEAEV